MIKVKVSVFSLLSFFCRRLKDCLEPIHPLQKHAVSCGGGGGGGSGGESYLAERNGVSFCSSYLSLLLFIQHNCENPVSHSSESRRQNKEQSLQKNLGYRLWHAGRAELEVGCGVEGAESAGHSLLIDHGRCNAATR